MKELVAVKGPRDLSIVEVTLKIANIAYQYREDRKIFEDTEQDFGTRQAAYVRLCRGKELLCSWKEIRADILKKGGGVSRKEVRVV